jgi:hypothetical protein
MAQWSSSYITDLPDSAFACVRGNDRFYPHHDASGKLDLPHLKAALSRIGDASNEQCGKGHLQAHAAAANVGEKADYLKAEQVSKTKWRVLAIPFGGPFKGKDLDGEFFSPRTDIKPDWFDRRPLVWHHNLDRLMKADPVLGTADDIEQTDDGWWATIWLDRSHRYWSQVDDLLRSGKIYGSSGSLPNFVRTDEKTGEILVWPYVEQTLTPTPSNFYSRVVPAKAIDHFDQARIGLPPALRGILSDLDSPTADLRSDLPEGGDDAAIQRLSGAIAQLEERLKAI